MVLFAVFLLFIAEAQDDAPPYSWTSEATQGTSNIEVTGDDYEFTVSFKHNTDLPIGDKDSCVPGKLGPDGLEMQAWREMYFEVDPLSEIATKTGVKAVAVDWNPCGNSVLKENFGKPLYDLHFHYHSTQARSTRECEIMPTSDVCDPLERESKFFVLPDVNQDGELINYPPGFTPDATSAVPTFGLHVYDQENMPTVEEWVDPVLLMGSYDGEVTYWEPMIPLDFIARETVHRWNSGPIQYTDQTMQHLPTDYTVEFDPATLLITFTLHGRVMDSSPEVGCSALCGCERALVPDALLLQYPCQNLEDHFAATGEDVISLYQRTPCCGGLDEEDEGFSPEGVVSELEGLSLREKALLAGLALSLLMLCCVCVTSIKEKRRDVRMEKHFEDGYASDRSDAMKRKQQTSV